jgi:hypothetical protein
LIESNAILEDRDMHSQLHYAAAKLEIADSHRRAEHAISSGHSAKPTRRRNPLARLFRVRRTTRAIDMAAARHDAC